LEAVSRVRVDDNAKFQTVDLAAVVSEVARQLREMSEARNVRVRIAPDLGTLTIDVARIELVFINLISNAIKYSDPGKPDRVVDVRRTDSAVDGFVIEVRDNGIGINPKQVDRIFDRFFRVHESGAPEHGTDGLGLGLAIVKECIDALKGSISVESVLGEGTTIRLSLA
jgi:signal transduction histidine kinase